VPNVRGSRVRTFADIGNVWPRAVAYANAHGCTPSDVVRVALENFLDQHDTDPAESSEQ
jgi:hypothetical protein